MTTQELGCYLCRLPAVTIAWGFAICGNGKCAEKARMSAWILAQGGDGYRLNTTISPSAIAEVFEQ